MVSTMPKTKVICGGCGQPIEIGEPAYQIQSGYIDENGEFVRADCQSQYFHIGNWIDEDCLNSR